MIHVVIEDLGAALGGGARYPAELRAALADLGVEQRVLRSDPSVAGGYVEVGTAAVPIEQWIDDTTWLLVHNPDTHALALAHSLQDRMASLSLAAIDLGGVTLSPVQKLVPRRIRYRRVEKYFAISEYSRRRLQMDPARARTIYGGGDHLLRAGAGRTFEPVDFTFVGRILPHKGIGLIVRSLPEGATLRCIGPGSTWRTPYGHDIADQLVKKGAAIEEDLSDADLRAALEASGWLVLPTLKRAGLRPLLRSELLGLVVLEAACVGTPALVSDAGALPEIAGLVGAVVCNGSRSETWNRMMTAALVGDRPVVSLPKALHWRSVASAVLDALWVR